MKCNLPQWGRPPRSCSRSSHAFKIGPIVGARLAGDRNHDRVAAVVGAEPGLVRAHETHFHREDRVGQIAQHERALVLENLPRHLSGEKILELVKVRLEDMRIDPVRAIDPFVRRKCAGAGLLIGLAVELDHAVIGLVAGGNPYSCDDASVGIQKNE
jgi:hypothetical protein